MGCSRKKVYYNIDEHLDYSFSEMTSDFDDGFIEVEIKTFKNYEKLKEKFLKAHNRLLDKIKKSVKKDGNQN